MWVHYPTIDSIGVVQMEGAAGAAQFAKGAGRHGHFGTSEI
jgi:hypothetical protein